MAIYQLLSAASLNLGRSQNGVLGNGIIGNTVLLPSTANNILSNPLAASPHC